MKKYLILIIMTLFMIPSVVLAATDLSQKDFDLAKKNGEYKGLAFSEEYNNYWFKKDGEYRLVSNVTLTNTIVINEADPELVLDLNGKTLTHKTTKDDRTIFISVYSSKFTIKGKGKITSNSNMKYILIGAEGSEIILDGCTIDGRLLLSGEEKVEKLRIKSGNFGSLSSVKGDITIEGGVFNATALDREVINVNENNNLVINGGTFESEYGALKSITSPNDYDTTTITINGGTFIGKENYGLILSGHEKLEINNGIFKDDNNTITITKDDKKDLEKLISTATITGTIDVISGDNSKYVKGVDNELSVTVDENIDYFRYETEIYGEVFVDNQKIEETNFSYSGNTTVTLKKSYLDTLKRGKHTLVVLSGYGDYATITFTVENRVNPILYAAVIFVCIIAISGVVICRKKINSNKSKKKN